MPTIYIDADACPVKDEIYRVAGRYKLRVLVVAKSTMHAPASELVEMVVRPGFGEVDDWIAEQAAKNDIVITSDIPLAARCLEKDALVLHPKGEPFTDNDIGAALAQRELMEQIRQYGGQSGGPSAMAAKDRSRFLAKLDDLANKVLRANR
ncbi:MAG: YaiI/YqxD family protein [Gemmataceae bacterium]|nr:YaiI/YqxD family protein [Gemmataceae bacterium]